MDSSPPGSSVQGVLQTRTLEWVAISFSKDSSERVLQSGSGGKTIYKVLVKGEFNTMKHSFYKRLFVGHEDLISP